MKFEQVLKIPTVKELQRNVSKSKQHSISNDELYSIEEAEKALETVQELLYAMYMSTAINKASIQGFSYCEFEKISQYEFHNLMKSGLSVEYVMGKWKVSWDK